MKSFPKDPVKFKKLIDDLGITHDSATTSAGEDRAIMQSRILAMLNEKRNSRLWIISVISAFAAVFSALAAWYAVFSCHCK